MGLSPASDVSNGLLVADALNTADTLVPLNSLRPSYLKDLFNHVSVQTVFKGQTLFEVGAYDKQHIYLQNGAVELHYPSGYIETIKAEECYTPLANIQPRQCKGVVATDSIVIRVDSDRVDRTVSWSQIADYLLAQISLNRDFDEDIEWIKTVLNSNLFLKAPPVNAEQILDRLTPMVVYKGEVVIRQGEIGDCCYFIKEGDATVSVWDEKSGETNVVADIHKGRCFGEDALVYETVRNATVTMETDGVLMRMEKSDFLLLLKEPSIDEVTSQDINEIKEEPVYIDVRTEGEYNAGHLAFSANIPLNLLSIKKRLLDSGTPYILYCDTGRRSKSAAYLLGKEGFNVMALKDGIIGQKMQELLVEEEGYILRNGSLISGQ